MYDLRERLFPGVVIAFIVLSAFTTMYAYAIRVQVSNKVKLKEKIDMKAFNGSNIYLKVMFFLSVGVILFLSLGVTKNCSYDVAPICHPIMYASMLAQAIMNCTFLLITFTFIDAVQQGKDVTNFRSSSLKFDDIYEIYLIGFASILNAVFIGRAWLTGDLD